MKNLVYLLELLMILLSIAFFTLLERKILGYSHFRVGPNKVGPMGIFQPFSDALKLFSKENNKLKFLNYIIFYFSPIVGMMVMVMSWFFIPFWGFKFESNFSIMLIFCILSISIYFLIGTGWSSNSKYSITGSYRSMAQAISYEVSMFLLIFCLMWFMKSYNISMLMLQSMKIEFLFPMFLIWLMICLAESNRTPFDFSEGESELVSGFNTEYGSGMFSLIFICEYGSILFLSGLTIMLFFSTHYYSMKLMFIGFFYVWIRSTLPRLRYDRLMLLSWKSILPITLGWLFLFFSF